MEYKITLEQVNALLQILGEIPAKLSLNAIILLQEIVRNGTDAQKE